MRDGDGGREETVDGIWTEIDGGGTEMVEGWRWCTNGEGARTEKVEGLRWLRVEDGGREETVDGICSKALLPPVLIFLNRHGDYLTPNPLLPSVDLLSDLSVIYDLAPAAVALTVYEHLRCLEHKDLLLSILTSKSIL